MQQVVETFGVGLPPAAGVAVTEKALGEEFQPGETGEGVVAGDDVELVEQVFII